MLAVKLPSNTLYFELIKTVFNSTERGTTSNLETRVNCNWKGRGRKTLWTILRHHPRICLQKLTYLSWDILLVGRDTRLKYAAYHSAVLTTQPPQTGIFVSTPLSKF